jgi:hypothetical protein
LPARSRRSRWRRLLGGGLFIQLRLDGILLSEDRDPSADRGSAGSVLHPGLAVSGPAAVHSNAAGSAGQANGPDADGEVHRWREVVRLLVLTVVEIWTVSPMRCPEIMKYILAILTLSLAAQGARAMEYVSTDVQRKLEEFWPSGLPFPKGMKFYSPERVFQRIVTDSANRPYRGVHRIEDFPGNINLQAPWRVPGGMEGVAAGTWGNLFGVRVPKRPGKKPGERDILVWDEAVNVPGTSVQGKQTKWRFPPGTIFADVLFRVWPDKQSRTGLSSTTFEVRLAERNDWSEKSPWSNKVAWRGKDIPPNYHGAGKACSECHATDTAGRAEGYGDFLRGADCRITWHPFAKVNGPGQFSSPTPVAEWMLDGWYEPVSAQVEEISQEAPKEPNGLHWKKSLDPKFVNLWDGSKFIGAYELATGKYLNVVNAKWESPPIPYGQQAEAAKRATKYEWYVGADPNRVNLWSGETLVGTYFITTGAYLDYTKEKGGKWGWPPVEAPKLEATGTPQKVEPEGTRQREEVTEINKLRADIERITAENEQVRKLYLEARALLAEVGKAQTKPPTPAPEQKVKDDPPLGPVGVGTVTFTPSAPLPAGQPVTLQIYGPGDAAAMQADAALMARVRAIILGEDAKKK